MTLIAVTMSALVAYLLAATVLGRVPEIRRPHRARPQVSSSQVWLVQAGTDLTPRQFWSGSIALGVVTFLLVSALTSAPAVAVVPAVAVGTLPRAWFARHRSQRLRQVQEAWPDGIRDLLAGISAGMSLTQSITAVAVSGPEALQLAFARFPSLSRMIGTVAALEVVKEELADPTSDRIIEVLILAHERGGHILSEILRDLADATTRDVRALEEIATDALEQTINARAVFVLPWFVLLVLTAREGFFREFYRSAGGALVVVIAALLSLLGIVLVSRLSREPDERRVLGASAEATTTHGEGGQ